MAACALEQVDHSVPPAEARMPPWDVMACKVLSITEILGLASAEEE